MRTRLWLASVMALLGAPAVFGAVSTALGRDAATAQKETAPPPAVSSGHDVRAVDGEWIYVEDRTEGRALDRMGPPMSSTFSLRVEDGAVILNGHGSGHRDVRIALDGSTTEIAEAKRTVKYRGGWKDDTFEYEVAFERHPGEPDGIDLVRRRFRVTPEGLLVGVVVDPPAGTESLALYRHAEDIPMPAAHKATIGDLSWLSGAWVGTKSTGSSIEERWTPPLGGAMLAVSRTVNTGGKMVAFEYLRVVERDGGLVYVAQPGGGKPTEFILTDLSPTRAVFDNPRHDYPKRIVYERSAEGGLSASVGFMKGGTPRRFDFTRSSEGTPNGSATAK
jgi:hypothetical protein